MNDLLAFNRGLLSGETGDHQAWLTIAEFCANVPQHPVCRLDGGHNPNDNGPRGGDLNPGHHDGGQGGGGDLGWYPFS
ncbi:MAG: hypothetical protein ACKOWF_16495 [Chloroflexota bacterium]